MGSAGTDQPWYWNGHGILEGDKFYVLEFQQRTAGAGHFGIEWVGTDLARLSLPDMQPERLTLTYDGDSIQWASSCCATATTSTGWSR